MAPSADAGGPYSAIEGGSVTLGATGVDLEGTTVTFAWDLDNNGSFESPGQNVNFSSAGITAAATRTVHEVHLIVRSASPNHRARTRPHQLHTARRTTRTARTATLRPSNMDRQRTHHIPRLRGRTAALPGGSHPALGDTTNQPRVQSQVEAVTEDGWNHPVR